MIHQGNIASVHMVRRLVSVIVTRSVFILWRSGFGSLLEQGTVSISSNKDYIVEHQALPYINPKP